MPTDIIVPIRDIVIPRKRMRTANHIEELAASIRESGLLHPITLRRAGERLILIAGLRRLKACKLLKEGEIRAQILTIDEEKAQLIEIDENLQRAELTALERANHVAERKKIWLSQHPETGQGKTPGNTGKGRGKAPKNKEPAPVDSDIKDATVASLISTDNSNGKVTVDPDCEHGTDDRTEVKPAPPFAEETANRTGIPKRTVQRYAEVGEKLAAKARDLLEGTVVADKITELELLAKKPHEEQIAIAQVLHDSRDEGQGKSGTARIKTVKAAMKVIAADRISEEPQPLPTGPFRVIVADPPWQYEKRSQDASKRENLAYPSMSLADIKALAVEDMAAEDAILWLWTTNAHLYDAFSVVSAWGFTFKTLLTWDKVTIGMGDWLRGQTEHCLLCVRGRPTVRLKSQTTLIRETRTTHSTKPEAFYTLVESLCPGSKVELFARKARHGWSAWGSEVLQEVANAD